MSIQIKSHNYSVSLTNQQSLYIDQKQNHSVSFSCDKKIKKIILNKNFLKRLNKLNVLEVFSIFQNSDDELKAFLVDSPFVPLLKSKFSSLYTSNQISIIASMIQLAKINLIHIKYPEELWDGPALHSLFLNLSQLDLTIIWEGKLLNNLCSFDFLVNSSGLIYQNVLPTSPKSAQNYFGEESYFLPGSFVSTDNDFFCKFGKLTIELNNDDKLLFLGLMNHEVLFSFIPSQFTFHQKQKKGFIKCDFIKQFKKAHLYFAHINFKGIPLLVKSQKKFSTPFIFVNLNLSQSLIFHKEKAKLLFPNSN
ncbi:MAG: hypothetical protein COB02_04830 [Candidatus Cloacimonadota bacterium]|nr:MAG: hypothetical protein COB02_04830 [Candidatus Cloacimonadota bacterium]